MVRSVGLFPKIAHNFRLEAGGDYMLTRINGTVGPPTERILDQEKTHSAQNRSGWGQAYVVKCKNTKNAISLKSGLFT